MDVNLSSAQEQQVSIASLSDFDRSSGSWVERLFFNNRAIVVLLSALLTLVLGTSAGGLRLNASFDKMLPIHHPYIQNYLHFRNDFPGLGNVLRIAVATRQGTIFDKDYLARLQKVNDEVFFVPGVDRMALKSLWTPNTRWIAVTEDGLEGGQVIGADYDGSPEALEQVRINVERAGEVGQTVARDYRSSVIVVPLMDHDPQTGRPLDYGKLSHELEKIRQANQSNKIEIHITGFAKVVGDLIDGLRQLLFFFGAAVTICMAFVFWYTRCIRSTILVVICSGIAVTWLLGLLAAVGRELNPYSILVPFLIFAIGMSHGAQKMNGIMQDVGRGTHRLVAARYTFRRLFLTGFTALLCDAVGFGVLVMIDIPIIQELAVIASAGVVILIFTNLVLLPILLSFTGVSEVAAIRSLRAEGDGQGNALWTFLCRFTAKNVAIPTVCVAALLAVGAIVVSSKLQVGDLDPGAPELRADSRYNRDAAFMTQNFGASSDVLVVFVQTPLNMCTRYPALASVDALEMRLRQLPEVEGTASLASLSKPMVAALNEGSPKWYQLIPTQGVLNAITVHAPREMLTKKCDTLALFVYLQDHKADTLSHVVAAVESFAADNNGAQAKFLLAAGNSGIEAATNIVVRDAMHKMLFWVYGAVIVLALVTFRSWRAVVCAVLPLMLTSVLCEALMVKLGMGVKVATLPVIALGVGIGVDYALYVLAVMLAWLRQGHSLENAYFKALAFTGKVVMLTGFTLGAAVFTWVFSPIKFQADMGLLLTFMFVWNMVGALFLLPALVRLIRRPPAGTAIR